MPQTLTIPRAFDPAYSLLGRWLLRRTGDARRAAAWVYAGTTLAVLACLLMHFGAWLAVAPVVATDPLGPAALAFFAFQALSLAAVLGAGLVGVRPAAHVDCRAGHVAVRQGARRAVLALEAVTRVEVVDAVAFHRHHARWAETRAFPGPRPAPLLLLWDARAPIALGLAADDREALLAFLVEQGVEVHAPSFTARVA